MSNFLIDEDTDLLAAEFVLGTLDSEERAGAHALLKTDHGFIAMVRIWERRFGELHLMVEPVDPDVQLWERVKSKVAGLVPAAPPAEGEPAASQAPIETAVEPMVVVEPPKPAESAAAEDAKPPEIPIGEPTPQPVEPAEAAKPAEAPLSLPPAPDLVIPPAPDTEPSPDAPPLEAIVKAPAAKVAIPGPPLSLPRLVDRPPETVSDWRPSRAEVTIDVIRSRSRWRAFGMVMMVLVACLVGLVGAWKFAPDQLPAALRPAQLMMSIGIDEEPRTTPGLKQGPLPPTFDE